MNLQLPQPNTPQLAVDNLAACVKNTTNSYKFYWFLAILDHIRQNRTDIIPINELLTQMVVNAWYPANYFYLSFGKQDQLGKTATLLQNTLHFDSNISQQELLNQTNQQLFDHPPLVTAITNLGKYVPYRFLAPFFNQSLRTQPDNKKNRLIVLFANESFNDPFPPLYRFTVNNIQIHPHWLDYLHQHQQILTSFCKWHLLLYLQKNNPNTPNIPAKLVPPVARDLSRARRFWDFSLSYLHPQICIYSGQPLDPNNFSLDHFIPWRFVVHDLLWNIVPTPKAVNSSKSDNLPDISLYFEPFTQMQYKALQIVADSDKHYNLLEDYVLLFHKESITQIMEMPFNEFSHLLHNNLTPQVQIARNMGFSTNWRWHDLSISAKSK